MFDYPIFEMPVLGHRLIFAIDAILHVLISHGAAVGGSIVLALTQWYAIKTNDQKLYDLTYKILFVMFIAATAIGALAGIGIWIHANIIDPPAIGSLLRVFFWKWFTEWIVFNVELIFLLAWFLTWKTYGWEKRTQNLKFGIVYAVSSWLTMVIITAILGFMLTPGNWLKSDFPAQPDYVASLFNPGWIPSLMFRTFFAIGFAAAISMYWTWWFTRNDLALREKAERWFGRIVLATIPMTIIFGLWYYAQIPQEAKSLMFVAGLTTKYIGHKEMLIIALLGAFALILVAVFAFYLKPKAVPFALASLMMVSYVFLVAEFERIREFVRKPYIIYGYMYAHGIRNSDVAHLNNVGVLKYASFVPQQYRTITEENKVKVGEYLFKLECRVCHSVDGVNAITKKVKGLDENAIYHRIGALNSPATPFMPPFVGTDEERKALAAYLATLVEQKQTQTAVNK